LEVRNEMNNVIMTNLV